MNGIKARLIGAIVLTLAALLTLTTFVYVGASGLQSNADRASEANDEVRELLTFALCAHRYMNAFGQSLGQRTLIANNERRVAAAHFEARVRDIPRHTDARSGVRWQELYEISSDLERELNRADELRAQGKFLQAERLYNAARQEHFRERMLPWFEYATEAKRQDVRRTEDSALNDAGTLRLTTNLVAGGSVVVVSVALLAVLLTILRPVRLLDRGASAIARGDLNHRIRYEGHNELGHLAARFNQMADALQSSRKELLDRNRALEDAYQLQGQFLSMMSHELRSPLHSILGYAEIVGGDGNALSERARRNISGIERGAQRLLALIDDILDFSKLRARRMTVNRQCFQIAELLQSVVDDAHALVGARPVEIVLEPPGCVGEMVSDETKVRQILTNLISNAVKFTERGEVRVGVASARDALRFTVADTGVGIPESQLPIIFEPFAQAPSKQRGAPGSSGLGLAIVSQLSTLLGGQVSVRSQVALGTTFTVELPRTCAGRNG